MRLAKNWLSAQGWLVKREPLRFSYIVTVEVIHGTIQQSILLTGTSRGIGREIAWLSHGKAENASSLVVIKTRWKKRGLVSRRPMVRRRF
jgi:hypothetical protein